jgi:hypothetical protein
VIFVRVSFGHGSLHVECAGELESVGTKEPQGGTAIDGLGHLRASRRQRNAGADEAPLVIVGRGHQSAVGQHINFQVEPEHQFATRSASGALRQHPFRYWIRVEGLRQGNCQRSHLAGIRLPHSRHESTIGPADPPPSASRTTRDILLVATVMGHNSTETTMGYVRISPSAASAPVEAISHLAEAVAR